MKLWFRKRESPERLIRSEMKKVKFSNLMPKNNDKKHNMKGIPLVVTYHPLLKSLSGIIDKNLSILYMDKEVKKVFTPGSMVSFRRARKLSSYLVRAKLYPLERAVGSYKCKAKRCQYCNKFTEVDSFTGSNDQLNFKINRRFYCKEKCLIYLIKCNECFKQYVGQTVNEFRHTWNNYKNNARKFERGEHCMQRHLHEHFNLSSHSRFLNDVSVTLTDKKDPKDPTKREDYWIQTLKTKPPVGLSIEDGL